MPETTATTSSYKFLVIRLQPYSENFGKRFVKTPKLYFTEVGLATHLLGLETSAQVARDPLRGNLFENLVVMELFKARLNLAREPGLYFARDQHGTEVDLVCTRGRDLVPIEIKSAQTFQNEMLRQLNAFRRWAPNRVVESHVIYGGSESHGIREHRLTSYREAGAIASA